MDPVSFTASLIAITTLAAQLTKAFAQLRDVCQNLPGRLHALSNEVSDLTIVLDDITALIAESNDHRLTPITEGVALVHTFNQLEKKLKELKVVVEGLTVACRDSKIPLLRARAWSKVQGRLLGLQEEIKTHKSHLNIALGASNSQDLLSIRLDLREVYAHAKLSAQLHATLHDSLASDMSRIHQDLTGSLQAIDQRVNERLALLERRMDAEGERFYRSQATQLKPEREGTHEYQSGVKEGEKRLSLSSGVRMRPDAVGFRLRRYSSTCRVGCPCICHKETRTATPDILSRIFGQLFIGHNGLPFIRPNCSDRRCQRKHAPWIDLEYWFPSETFCSQIIRFQYAYQANIGPQFSLSTLRRVPDNAPAVEFALCGNTDGLKDLFRQGMASPQDVSNTRGYSLLRWALYGHKYETCTFLLNAGADAEYGPAATHQDTYYNTPTGKARTLLLQGGLFPQQETVLRLLAQGDDWKDEQDFTLLHKAVLGMSSTSIEEVILQHPDDLDAEDAVGRTPLSWAAARADHRSVALLLEYGADPNAMETHGSTPLHNAADRGCAKCCRLLLEAGANPDPPKPKGSKSGSPLNCAVRESTDPLTVKALLDFGANVESSGADGKTSLMQVARMDKVEFALLLLEYGADINAVASTGDTPLTTAVTYNSHKVLKLLLDRWFEYSECPRMKGPHLLSIVSQFADIETMDLLTNTDHLRLKYDQQYASSDYASQLNGRHDNDEKLGAAFQGLMDIINAEVATNKSGRQSPVSLLESGLSMGSMLRNRRTFNLNTRAGDSAESSDTEGFDAFEDALERL